MYKTLKAHAGKLLSNLSDLYLLALIAVGIPFVVYLYSDWRGAIAVSVLLQTVLIILWKRAK